MIEFLTNSDTILNSILGLIGIIIGSSSWVIKKAFTSNSESIKRDMKEVTNGLTQTSDEVKNLTARLYSIEKDISVQKAESSGLFNRMEDIIKSFRSDFERYDSRINNLERDQYIKARSVKRQ